MSEEYKTSLTDEHKNFLQGLFKDGASFDPEVLRVYASDASLRVGTVLAMVGVGRAISLVNHFFKDKMCRAAGML